VKEALRSAAKASQKLQRLFVEGEGLVPSVIDKMWDLLHDPDTPPAVQVRIAQWFAEQSRQRELAAEYMAPQKTTQEAANILNLQVNTGERIEDRIREIENALAGVPRVGRAS